MSARRSVLGVAISVMVASTCTGGPVEPSPSPAPNIGGTLRIGVDGSFVETVAEFVFVDPAVQFAPFLSKCCLARTLLSYPGLPTADGGTILRPDLAAEMPTISRDGLTWTFTLRHGIRYAPPYDELEVVATDFIETVERHARVDPGHALPGPDRPYGFVAGATDYADGNAPTISGLSAPDPHTLVVRLIEPFAAFGALLADPAWAPLPAAALTAHGEDLGPHWVSTGPYMYETYPGTATDGRTALVRNPAWRREDDPLRGAWVERIELSMAQDADAAYDLVEQGELDLATGPVPAGREARYRSDPLLAARLRSTTEQVIFWIPMNLAVPPFDDVAVRRAVNAVVNRAALRDLITAARGETRGPQPPGVVTHHAFPDSLTGGLLLTYAPWASPGDRGDLGRARTEMAASRYDTDHDGTCDADACRGVLLPAADPAAGEQLRADLGRIGIEATVVEIDDTNDMSLPANRTAIQVNLFGWGYNLTGSDLAQLMQGGPQMVDPDGLTVNFSLVGASGEQLQQWGYEVTEVPSVDDLLAACDAETGHLRARCWATFDQYATEVMVPWVPLYSWESTWLVSERVAAWTLDQAAPFVWISISNVSLKPGAAQ